jgi:hypothetical protein
MAVESGLMPFSGLSLIVGISCWEISVFLLSDIFWANVKLRAIEI